MYLGCVWKWIRSREQNYVSENRHASLYSVKVIKMSRRPIDRLSFHGRFTSCETDRETDCTALLSLDTQDIERGQSSMKGQCFLTAPICSRDGVWNFVSASDKTNTNTPIVSLGEGNHHVIMWSCDHVIMWSYPLSYHSILKNNTKKTHPHDSNLAFIFLYLHRKSTHFSCKQNSMHALCHQWVSTLWPPHPPVRCFAAVPHQTLLRLQGRHCHRTQQELKPNSDLRALNVSISPGYPHVL